MCQCTPSHWSTRIELNVWANPIYYNFWNFSVYFRCQGCVTFQMRCFQNQNTKPGLSVTLAALCALCDKSIDISMMGKTAVTSHASSKKHKDNVTQCSSSSGSMLSYVASTSSSLPSSSSTKPRSTLSQHVPGRAQLVADLGGLWKLSLVTFCFPAMTM